MTTQTALLVQEVGKPVVSVNDWPILKPAPHQIQVRVTVAGLNPHDQKSRDLGLFVAEQLPAVLANDVAGMVTAVGSNASRFKVGDVVFGQASLSEASHRGLQEYTILDEDFVAAVPKGINDNEAVTLPTNIVAGIIGFFTESGLGLSAPWDKSSDPSDFSNSSILIVGGGTNCGRFATQLASLVGFATIVVLGGNEQQLKSLGATHVVDRHGGHEAVLQRVRDIVHDDLLYAFETYNGPSEQHLAINALSSTRRGKLARLVFRRSELQTEKILPKQAGYELGNVIGASDLHREVSIPFWKSISEYLKEGKIQPLDYVTEQGLDAGKVNEVLDKYRDNRPVQQTHFRVSEQDQVCRSITII